MRKLERYGWRRDTPDHRDALHRWEAPAPIGLPPAMNTSKLYPEIYNQGGSSSCTGHSGAATACHERARRGLQPPLTLSRLFLYYGARVIGGNVDSDDGAEIRDVFKTLAGQGCPREDVWPFDGFQVLKQPSPQAYAAAKWHKAVKYRSVVQSHDTLCGVVAAGKAFSFGFSVYESFESKSVAASGVMPMPGKNEGQIGGHAVSCAGYDEGKRMFFVRNSWGVSWGQSGYFWMPYDYMLDPNMSSDFWVVDEMSA